MAKKKTLTKIDKFYIENNRAVSTKQLSDDLNVLEKVVKEYEESLPEVSDEVEQPETQMSKLMGRHKNRENVSVMTSGASELSDDARQKIINAKKNQPHIFKPKGENYKGNKRR